MAAKKTKSKAPSKTPNKSEFIRLHPNTPAPELVNFAKSKGIKITTAFIYTIRSSDKAKAAKATSKVKAPISAKTTLPVPGTTPRGAESTLIDLVVDLGGKTVQDLLAAAIARVKATAKK